MVQPRWPLSSLLVLCKVKVLTSQKKSSWLLRLTNQSLAQPWLTDPIWDVGEGENEWMFKSSDSTEGLR